MHDFIMTDNTILPVSKVLDAHLSLDSYIHPIIALSLIGVKGTEGIFSRITMTSMTSSWYHRISHFEAILVGLVVLQIFVMRYFLILPLDVTKLIEDGTLLATDISRKRRSAFVGNYRDVMQTQRLAETMFSILRRLDDDDCFLRTLCELEIYSSSSATKFGKNLKLLTTLKRLGLKRMKFESELPPNNITIVERKVLAEFEDAVLLGSGYHDGTQLNNNTCEKTLQNRCAAHYSLCNAESGELLAYVNDIMPFLLYP